MEIDSLETQSNQTPPKYTIQYLDYFQEKSNTPYINSKDGITTSKYFFTFLNK